MNYAYVRVCMCVHVLFCRKNTGQKVAEINVEATDSNWQIIMTNYQK